MSFRAKRRVIEEYLTVHNERCLDFARHDKKPARRPADALDRCWHYDPFVSHRQFAVAARRLRSSQAGIYLLRNDQGRTLVLSADAARTCGDQATVGGMDVSRSLHIDPIMGSSVAAAITSRRDWLVDLVVSLCQLCLRNNCRHNRTRCIWIKSSQSTPGDTRAHGHAAGLRNFSNRLIDLAENSGGRTVEASRSILHLRIAHRRDVDQGSDRLRVFASGDCAVSMACSCSRGRGPRPG